MIVARHANLDACTAHLKSPQYRGALDFLFSLAKDDEIQEISHSDR